MAAIRDRLCIGDGYIFVFEDEVLATFFAARLAVMIEHHSAKNLLPIEFHFRMGIHAGPVYRFWDAGRNRWNFIGDGINGGARVLQAIGREYDDLIFLSDTVRQAIRTSKIKSNLIKKGLMKAMRPRGRREDKHGNHWRLFELTHDLIEK